jgi:hypothetical protein
MAIPPGGDVTRRANARFRELFGREAGDGRPPTLEPLERELCAALRRAETFPWQILFRDLRAAPDGSLIVESFPEGSAIAVSTSPSLPPRASIRAKIIIQDGNGRQADVVFGYQGPREFHKIAFGSAGYVTLLHYYEGHWEVIAKANCDSAALAAGVAHDIEVTIEGRRIVARVDGRTAFDHALGKAVGGRYGIGAYDGRVVFREVRAGALGR